MKEKAMPLLLQMFEIPKIRFIKYIIYIINNTLKLHMYDIHYAYHEYNRYIIDS